MKKLLLILLLVINVFSQNLSINVSKVYDGDTFYANIFGIPDVFGKNIGIRLTGIDCPEINSKDSCEKKLAIEAKNYLKSLLSSSDNIILKSVKRDKYFRLNAIVYIGSTNINDLMIKKGFAKKYTGSGDKPNFKCF